MSDNSATVSRSVISFYLSAFFVCVISPITVSAAGSSGEAWAPSEMPNWAVPVALGILVAVYALIVWMKMFEQKQVPNNQNDAFAGFEDLTVSERGGGQTNPQNGTPTAPPSVSLL